MRYRALLTVLLLSGTTGGAVASSDRSHCGRWQAIAESKMAADGGTFDQATSLAQHSESLENASIAQAKEQETLWRDAVIR